MIVMNVGRMIVLLTSQRCMWKHIRLEKKFSNTVVVPRVIASKCAELVAVVIDTPVVDKP